MLNHNEEITAKAIQEEFGIYTFENLSDNAVYNVVDWHFQTAFAEDWRMIIEYEVDERFPHSTIEAHYDFSYCQGCGVNLYGTFNYNDLRVFAGYKPVSLDFDIKISSNWRCAASSWDTRGRVDEILDEVYNNYFWEYGEGIAQMQLRIQQDAVDAICDKMNDLCDSLYNLGEAQIEDYFNADYNECYLFDEFGRFEGMTWDKDYILPVFDSIEEDTDNDHLQALNYTRYNLFGDIVECAHVGGLDIVPITPAISHIYLCTNGQREYICEVRTSDEETFNTVLTEKVAAFFEERDANRENAA